MENRKLSPIESARHIAEGLQETIEAIPGFATPKYPLPSIMKTEQQIAIMFAFANEGDCDEECLNLSKEEIGELLAKARILRARVLVRRLRKKEGSCEDARTLSDLVADGFVGFADIRIKEDDFIKLLKLCTKQEIH